MLLGDTIRRRTGGFYLGAGMTLVACLAFTVGTFDSLDHLGLDLHFRRFGGLRADPRIVLVDIDDHALREMPDWPWPRERIAEVVRTLTELGAQAIVLDLIFSDPATPRTERASLGRHYDVDTQLTVAGDPRFDPTVFDDDELRAALHDAGNAYMAMFARIGPEGAQAGHDLEPAIELVRRNPAMSWSEFQDQIRSPATHASDTHLDRAILITTLEQGGYVMDELAVREWIRSKRGQADFAVRNHLPFAKRFVAARAARDFFASRPEQPDLPLYSELWREFHARVMPPESFETLSADRETLLIAFRGELAFQQLVAKSTKLIDPIAGSIPIALDLTLPVEKFVPAARGVGLVSFDRDRSGGVLRSVPVILGHRGFALFQLGVLVASDVAGIDRQFIYLSDGTLHMGRGSAQWALPLDSRGEMLLNWVVPTKLDRWLDTFVHVPVTRILQVTMNRRAIEENEQRGGLAMGELIQLRFADAPAEFAGYAELVNARAHRRNARTPSGAIAITERTAEDEELENRIRDIEVEAREWLERAWRLWEDTEPFDETESRQRSTIERLNNAFHRDQIDNYLLAASRKLSAEAATILEELRPTIQGSICLVGYTASGEADLVTSPVFSAMPGVMAHANMINTLLQDRVPQRGSMPVNVLMITLAGLLMTVVTCIRGPVTSLTSLLVLGVLCVIVGGFLFRQTDYHLSTLVAASTMSLPWAAVTIYRQMTEERVRRRFERALAQYTSPAVAAQIATRAESTDLAPRPATVTCFFSDLRGFTRISEQLGPERTKLLLNPYLETMSRILTDRNAIVNKFIGDGVFAFFNAPIWPCTDHARAGCTSAVASLEGMERLNRANGGRLPPLVVRVGLATGDAFVGDYGSERKLDYTCIGDTVNLASRLEQLNKNLGTSVLLDGSTRDRAGSGFVFRPLGSIRVAGREQSVDVFELMGPSPSADGSVGRFIEEFTGALRDYQACQWDRSRKSFERCLQLKPDDRATARYLSAIGQYSVSSRPSDWDGSLDLSDELQIVEPINVSRV